ncbi:unnamed protein product [Strongylus vulgaris]|uniref:Reverse transcriptase domain-containing protein n=1 Tax=Strongylus vulgaris TaxID=40348 RepID=A0A3P7JE62_STRVU|nr:unnamed protein product [Strongylus vulgaris]
MVGTAVPEIYIQWIKMIYHGATSHVQGAAGQSKLSRIKTGVHQGSVLSPLLLTVMDAATEGLKRQPSWGPLYADDVVLMAENRKELKKEAQRWKDQLGSYGLKLNTKKTEYMKVGDQTSGSI